MATEQQREMLRRRGLSTVSVPTLELPKVPARFKRRPEDREAWEEFERELDRWRKTLFGGAIAIAASGSSGGGAPVIPGSPGGGQGPSVTIPPVEEDLHAVYLMETIWG